MRRLGYQLKPHNSRDITRLTVQLGSPELPGRDSVLEELVELEVGPVLGLGDPEEGVANAEETDTEPEPA